RSEKEFIKVNCSALPKELIEAELFGYVKGAFTGAMQNRQGLIAQAKGGSLMLDEIGEMPMELQPKLLRVLEERKFRPVGSTETFRGGFRLDLRPNPGPWESNQGGHDARSPVLQSLDDHDQRPAAARARRRPATAHRLFLPEVQGEIHPPAAGFFTSRLSARI